MELLNLDLNIDNNLVEDKLFADNGYRGIQTHDPLIARQVIIDFFSLVKKYEEMGCTILR